MIRPALGLAASLVLCAQAAAEGPSPSPSMGVDVFASSDAEDTEVRKLGVSVDWRNFGPDDLSGLRLEKATFKPLGEDAQTDWRIYYRFGEAAAGWTWNGQVGTDGAEPLGALTVHNEGRFRQEYFLEREIIETPQGLERGIYYTFVGGAFDVPLGARDSASVVVAAQEFTGRNLRTHLRLNYVRSLRPEWGLTAQLRARYFHSSRPGEFDYFSPRNFVQVTPTLQLRRRTGGWRYVVAAGLGAQRQTAGKWRPARSLSAQVSSPPAKAGWSVEGAVAYSNTPVGAGATYDYRQITLGVRRAF
jgi:hypothetical protein